MGLNKCIFQQNMIKTSSDISFGQTVHLFNRFNDSAIYVGQVFKKIVNSSLDFLNRNGVE